MDKVLSEYQDPDNWITNKDSVVDPTKPVSATVAIRFSREELHEVDEAAERSGMKATEFIKRVALAWVRSEGDVTAVSSLPASRTSLR